MLVTKRYGLVVVLLITLLFIEACKENRVNDPEMKAYVEALTKERKENDYSMQFDKSSPFNRDTSVAFKTLNFYEPNPDFIFKSKLFTYEGTGHSNNSWYQR